MAHQINISPEELERRQRIFLRTFVLESIIVSAFLASILAYKTKWIFAGWPESVLFLFFGAFVAATLILWRATGALKILIDGSRQDAR
jgi:di/tricarboxylate transporter